MQTITVTPIEKFQNEIQNIHLLQRLGQDQRLTNQLIKTAYEQLHEDQKTCTHNFRSNNDNNFKICRMCLQIEV